MLNTIINPYPLNWDITTLWKPNEHELKRVANQQIISEAFITAGKELHDTKHTNYTTIQATSVMY
jgi:hypothetical protein